MRAFVAVSGLPASGKTTLASAIANALLFPHFDKDHFLKSLFDLEGIGTLQNRRDLCVRADMQFSDAEKPVLIPDLVAAVRSVLRQQHVTLSGLGR